MNAMYVFDFDGVLFDSAPECLHVAYKTAREQAERLPFARAFTTPDPSTELAETFLRHRYFVGPPWQYALLLRCVVEQRVPASTTEFIALAAAERPALEFFSLPYFAKRTELSNERAWFSLVAPFSPIAETFRALFRRGHAAILSTRDDRSITALCAHHLDIELTDQQLLPRSGAREKWEILLDHAEHLQLSPRAVFFIDDYLQHALLAYQRGISAHLATWGYLGPTDVQEARATGLPCVALEDLDSVLRTHQEAIT